MTVLTYPDGKQINWRKMAADPGRATRMVMWNKKSVYGQTVRGSLFVIASLDDMDRKAREQFGTQVSVIQPCYNVSVSASAGTHDLDYCIDWWIFGVDGYVQQRFGRFENGWCTWYRQPWQGFTRHQHGFPMPPGGHDFPTPVGIYVDGHNGQTSSQLVDYWHEAYGLKGMHDQSQDPSAFPTDAEKMRFIFNLDRYIDRQREAEMEYKDWSDESKKNLTADVAKRLLDAETVSLKKDNGSTEKIPIRNAVQRILNDTPSG